MRCIQHALYQDLGPTRQASHPPRRGRSPSTALTGSSGARVNELARHWGLTGRASDAPRRRSSTARLAGDAALKSLAPVRCARRHFEQAGERHDSISSIPTRTKSSRSTSRIGLGTAQQQTGDPAFRETLLGAARRAAAIGDTRRLVTAVLANGRGWYSAKRRWSTTEKVELLQLALERVPPGLPRPGACSSATLCSEMAFVDSVDERLRRGHRGRRRRRRHSSDAEVTVRVLNHTVYPLMVPWLLDQSMAWSERALDARRRDVGDPVLHFNVAVLSRATLASRAFDVDEMDRCYAIVGDLGQLQLDQPALNWEYTFHIAKRKLIAGDTDEAELLATEALTLGMESGQPDAATLLRGPTGGGQLSPRHHGRPHSDRRTDDDRFPRSAESARGVCHHLRGLWAGRRRQAVAGGVPRWRVRLRDDPTWMNGMCEWAITAHAVADPVLAEPIYDRALRGSVRHGGRCHDRRPGRFVRGCAGHGVGSFRRCRGPVVFVTRLVS